MSMMQKLMQTVARFKPDRPVDPLVQAHRYVGQAIDRVDGAQKVTGAATFTAEYPMEGVAHAALVLSTIPKGRITAIDTGKAECEPGILLIMTHENAPRMLNPSPLDPTGQKSTNGSSRLPIMQDGEIHWNGQPVAVVVAETLDQAEHAAALIMIGYEGDADAAIDFNALKQASVYPKAVLTEKPEVSSGDAEKALVAAAHRVDARYFTPKQNQTAIELHATIAKWDDSETLTIFDSTQFVYGVRETLAEIFSLKPEKVRVLAPFVGGAFGSKCNLWNHAPLAVAAAKLCGRPVKLVPTRRQVFHMVGGRTNCDARVALGADANGRFVSLIHTGTTATVDHAEYAEQFSFPARHLYAAGSYLISQKIVYMNIVANSWMRGVGEAIGQFALESAIDELAYAMDIDPIELRRINEPVEDPTAGTRYTSRNLVEMCRRGAERFGWQRRAPRSQRDGHWLIGQGVATAYYPVFRMPATARIRVEADGTATVSAAAHEMGMGTATVQIQHAAERLGLPLDRVSFVYGDSNLPRSPIAGGSNQTVSIGASTRAAADELHARLLDLANVQGSPLRGVKTSDSVLREGGIHSSGGASLSFADILTLAGVDHFEVEASAPMPFELLKYSMASYGAQFCEVRVHEGTGETRVSRWLGAFDCGRILNPKTAISQLRGGIIMGIGAALMEETVFDPRNGRIATTSFGDYHFPTQMDVPYIDVIYSDIPDEQTPIGARSVGEIGITGVAPAIANAVHNATGMRIRKTPITLDQLL